MMIRFLFIIVSISTVLIIAGINRGFDFSDEGLYSFLADPKQANEGGVINYDLFFKILYQFLGIEFGIIGLRIFRLFSYLAGAWALAFFWKNIQSEKSISLEIYLLGVLGIFAGYAFLPPSLSYNSMSVILACFWLAIISKIEKQWIDHLLVGSILGFLFYVKITSCFILGSLTIGLIVYKREFNWKWIFGLVIPFLILELSFLVILKETGFGRIWHGLEIMSSRKDYGYVLLFKYLALGVFWLLTVFIPFLISGYLSQNSKYYAFFAGLIGVTSLVMVFNKTFITDEWNHSVLLFTIAIVGFILGKNDFRYLSVNDRINLFLLFGMPFFLFFGSNVYWLRLGIHYWVFWVFGLMILCTQLPLKVRNVLKIGIAVLSLVVVSNGIWLNPFGQQPLWFANQTWEYDSGKGILLTQKQVDLLNELKQKTDQYASDEILAVYRIPGIVYLLNKNSPKSPGYWSKSHLNSYFPEGINPRLIIYEPSDSLPEGDWNAYKNQRVGMPNGQEIRVLWR